MKKALISGITGQDGSYLSEFLLSKGYEIHGIIRRSSSYNTQRIEHLYVDSHDPSARVFLHYGDMTDTHCLQEIVHRVKPDEIYHLACQSHVLVSFKQPIYTTQTAAVGTLSFLDAARTLQEETGKQVKFYNASSSEMFGSTPPPQSEQTSFHPRSPYAIGKLSAYWSSINYREAYNLFACNGILFNHDGPRRGENFVTRKITRAIGRIKNGSQNKLYLGNLVAKRDWGFAGDFVEAMWMMLQHDKPDDYVVATGESYSVQEFVDKAFAYAGLDPKEHVEIDPRYFRPSEVDSLCGDSSKIRSTLGWKPKTSFDQLVKMMVDSDIILAKSESRQV